MLLALLPLASESSTMKIHSSDKPWWSKNCFKHDGFWVFCAIQSKQISHHAAKIITNLVNHWLQPDTWKAQIALLEWVLDRSVSALWFPPGPSVCKGTPLPFHHTGPLHSPAVPPALHPPEARKCVICCIKMYLGKETNSDCTYAWNWHGKNPR